MTDFDDVVPLRFDMSDMVRQTVATLYSHLVTRPTGQALRLGIEAQIAELGALSVNVLDFSEVVVLDYSCADETVAKLVKRFLRSDRPAEAYFVARGIDDRHHETIDTVLARQSLAITAELSNGEAVLLGEVTPAERAAWEAVDRMNRARTSEVVSELSETAETVEEALESLADRRVVARIDIPRTYFALRGLLAD